MKDFAMLCKQHLLQLINFIFKCQRFECKYVMCCSRWFFCPSHKYFNWSAQVCLHKYVCSGVSCLYVCLCVYIETYIFMKNALYFSVIIFSWYHPNADRHIAESLLMQNAQDGSYLMRPSSIQGEFALSIRLVLQLLSSR